MDILRNRLESYVKLRRAKGSSRSHSNLGWPHPEYFMATPETLAEAGFYFDPNSEDNDLVTCYMCSKQLGEWSEKDDPFEIHFKKCGKKCAWASVRCGLVREIDLDGRFVFTDKNRLPTSKLMEKARLETFKFGQGWIHDQEKNHGASSKKMAKAGFVYSPHDSNDDTAACLYCRISLSGWDADDDPTEEHRKRVKKAGHPCPMFPDIVFAPETKALSRSQSRSTHADVTVPIKTHDGSDEELGSLATTRTAKTPKASHTTRKGTRTPRAPASSKSQNFPIDDNDEELEEQRQRAPSSTRRFMNKPTAAPKTRSRSVSRRRSVLSVADSDAGTATDDEVVLTRSTSTRSKGKAKSNADDEGGAALPTKKPKKTRSQSKARVSVIPENQSAEDDDPAPPPTKKTVTKKASAKSASSKQREEEADVHATGHAKKHNSTNLVATASDDEGLADGRIDVDGPEPLAARSIRATRSTKAPTQDHLVKNTAGLRGKHSRTASATSRRGGRSRQLSLDSLEDTNVPIQPASTPSLEPGLEPSRKVKAAAVSKTKEKQRYPPSDVENSLSDQDRLAAPPIPPRSPSRPKPRPKPDFENLQEPEYRAEAGRPPSSSRTDSETKVSGVGSLTSRSMKPIILTKPATMTRKGSFLTSRASSQSRAADQVLDISSDEDEDTESIAPVPELSVDQTNTESKVLAKAGTHPVQSGANGVSLTSATSDEKEVKSQLNVVELEGGVSNANSRLRSNVFEEGNVQAKISRIERTAKQELEMGGRTSPFKAKFAPDGLDQDAEMFDLATTPAKKVNTVAEEAPTTPTKSRESERPTSPFKTPFRFGGPGNPFKVPPTPGVPVDIPIGIPIPLSKELFVPTRVLSEVELSMTVEEWIRHHMQIEYNKFKEDAEGQITAFTNKAEQTRKTIEAL
ncbi:hypothetical protein D9757_004327 [Collybiopsis confluens]|uniref:Uncharacterized protein n=1 Tax=Collybiopsis confluens TaxID=2823264 RepID=A0A8H5HUH5_9AGAR|nr:hypothetical protein D9757_004327 [Collybiopsis confluens]